MEQVDAGSEPVGLLNCFIGEMASLRYLYGTVTVSCTHIGFLRPPSRLWRRRSWYGKWEEAPKMHTHRGS